MQQGTIEPVNPKHWRQNCLYLMLQQWGDRFNQWTPNTGDSELPLSWSIIAYSSFVGERVLNNYEKQNKILPRPSLKIVAYQYLFGFLFDRLFWKTTFILALLAFANFFWVFFWIISMFWVHCCTTSWTITNC